MHGSASLLNDKVSVSNSKAPRVTATKISDGLGFGEGTISTMQLCKQLGEAVYDGVMQQIETALDSPAVIVPVDKDDDGHTLEDDGCGDGRPVLTVFNNVQTFKRSLHRPKVFGGGVAMSVAALIGLGKAAGQSLQQVFHIALNVLKDRMIDFGAHTDDHATDPNCGCGAIDKAPLVVELAVKYQAQIRATIQALGEDLADLDQIEANYRTYAEEIHGQQGYSGKTVIDEIVDSGKIVKKLKGTHIEAAIVLNTIENCTVNQGAIREATDGRADVFAVDVWRMQKLARKMYGDLADRHKAYLSELVYMLATAAALTGGDLPVYLVQAASEQETDHAYA